MSHEVIDIASSTEGTRVHCSNGSTFLARKGCIITLPLGVLRSKDIFTGEKSPKCVQNILDSPIEPGLMNIVWLWYPYKFWPSGINYLGVCSKNYKDFSTFLIPHLVDSIGNEQSVLMCQVVGEFGLKIEMLNDFEIAQRATECLRDMLRHTEVPDAVGCCHSSWMSDPHTLGSWSYFPFTGMVGRCDEHCEYAEEEEEMGICRYEYAGEAESITQRGTAHGAYNSGVQAADRLIGRMQCVGVVVDT